MNFGAALVELKNGGKVTRRGWNGQGMFLYLVPGSTFIAGRPPLDKIFPGEQVAYRPHIDMLTADGTLVPWVASQSDLLADDWILA